MIKMRRIKFVPLVFETLGYVAEPAVKLIKWMTEHITLLIGKNE
jgi:hypothetical protein